MGSKTFKQIVFIPVILFYIGAENYGDYIAIVAYSGLYSLFDIDFNVFFTRVLSRENKKIRKERLVSTSLIIMIINILISFIIGFVLINMNLTLVTFYSQIIISSLLFF